MQGSLPRAQAGELKILAGGVEQDLAAVRGVLGVLGSVQHVGPLGSGAATKLVVNIALAASFVMVGEALALADRLGLDTDAALDALTGTVVAPLIPRVRERLADPAAPTQFALALADKDLGLALDAGAVPDGVIAGARSRLAASRQAGLGDQDISAVLGYLRATSDPPS